jgi:hypothetical protein
MSGRRLLVAGDLAAMLLFALIGVASHEEEVSLAVFARSFLPFAATWLTLGLALGAFRMDRPSPRLLAVYLVCGVTALVARSVIFDRTLLNAFFAIALAGNGALLFAWRWARARPRPKTAHPEGSKGAVWTPAETEGSKS